MEKSAIVVSKSYILAKSQFVKKLCRAVLRLTPAHLPSITFVSIKDNFS